MTNIALVYEGALMRGRGGVAGSQPMSTAVHMERGAQINFGDLPPYLTYALTSVLCLGLYHP